VVDQAIVNWTQIISGFATAGALVFIWYQSRQTKRQLEMAQHQMDNTLRPWIALDINGITNDNGKLNIRFKNAGQLPAISVQISAEISLVPLSKEKVEAQKIKGPSSASVMLPNSYRHIVLEIPDYQSVLDKELPVYLAIRVDYKYAKKETGKYILLNFINYGKDEEGLISETVE
jgi:hypothetical protein